LPIASKLTVEDERIFGANIVLRHSTQKFKRSTDNNAVYYI
jgi:hypothetical protein